MSASGRMARGRVRGSRLRDWTLVETTTGARSIVVLLLAAGAGAVLGAVIGISHVGVVAATGLLLLLLLHLVPLFPPAL